MAKRPKDLVEALVKGRGTADIDKLVALYAPNATIVTQNGSAHGLDGIRTFLAGYVAAHGRFDLLSIDGLTSAEDTIVFEASVETDAGVLQIAEVVIVGHRGITHHIPGLRGYWGR